MKCVNLSVQINVVKMLKFDNKCFSFDHSKCIDKNNYVYWDFDHFVKLNPLKLSVLH